MRPVLVLVAAVVLAVPSTTATAATPVYLRPLVGVDAFGPLVTADTDHDGRPDLITLGDPASAHAALLHNAGNGRFGGSVAFDAGRYDPQLADLNGDGSLDLVSRGDGPTYGRWDATPLVVDLARAGGFASLPPSPAPERVDSLALGDFDGDGHIDAVEASFVARRVWLFRGDGSGAFAPPVAYPFGGDYSPADFERPSLLAADLNGDGASDLVLTGAPCRVMLGDRTDGFAAPMTVAHGCAGPAADVNGDGHIDLVANKFLLGRGDGHFDASGPALPASRAPNVITNVIADVTADGRPDLIAAGATTVAVATALPHAGFTAYHYYWAVPQRIGIGEGGFFATPEAVADFNSDGLADVAAETYAGTVLYFAAHLKLGRCANPTAAGFLPTTGTTYGDTMRPWTLHAREYGGPGDDCLYAGERSSVLAGGAGNDVIHARNHAHDAVDCGRGRDTAYVDRQDRVRRCERVVLVR